MTHSSRISLRVLMCRQGCNRGFGGARHRLALGVSSIVLVSALLGCGSADVVGVVDPEQTLLWVRLNTNAVTLATAPSLNTVQLSATAYRGDGTVIPNVVTAYATGNANINVAPDGLVTALKATIKARVIATVTYQGVTRTDTALITVVDTTDPIPLTTLRIQVDSNVPAGLTSPLGIIARDANDVDRSDIIPVHITTSDSRVARIHEFDGWLSAIIPERSVTIYATTMYYGVILTDSVRVNVGYPQETNIAVIPRHTAAGETILTFEPNPIYVRAGGTVLFLNAGDGDIPNTEPIDVVFETPEAVRAVPNSWLPTGDGNIPPFMHTEDNPIGVAQIRLFPTAGTYHYRSERFGTTGTIVVR